MDIIVQNGSIHIFFSKKLPVANMYNVYHIHKNANDKTPYIEYSWKKNSLSEIYSQSIENSYSLLPVKTASYIMQVYGTMELITISTIAATTTPENPGCTKPQYVL